MLKPEVCYNNRYKVSKPVIRVNKKIKNRVFKYLQFGLKMKKIVLEKLFGVYTKKNYKIFENEILYNLNISSIRNNDMNPNKFSDWICCFYKDKSGEQKFYCWPAKQIGDFII